MTQFPSLKGEQIIRVLKKADFEVIRVKGSHHFLKHSDGRCTVVPQEPPLLEAPVLDRLRSL
jgi:predicted RNA binding protein YcfA (HicA-like mRNA interferase family)